MIDTLEALRALYPEPKELALKKQLSRLDRHCERFIALSPFAVVTTVDSEYRLDASPRGGKPGFVRVVDSQTLQLPDSPGNNRLDSLSNIVATGRIGLVFFIPGVDETLRVNGRACLNDEPDLVAQFADDKRIPRLVIEIAVEEAYLHCAKALMRSKLWSPASRQERSVMPTMGQMLKEQTGTAGSAETQEQMLARYQADL